MTSSWEEKWDASPEPIASQEAKQIPLQRVSSLHLRTNTPKGRGVFTSAAISSGTVLEVCPVLVFEQEENEQYIAKTQLYNYTYNWPIPMMKRLTSEPTEREFTSREDELLCSYRMPSPGVPTGSMQALVLGLGSMFNHRGRGRQNVGWHRDVRNGTITYFAVREIAAGEELCISYGDRLTFADADDDAEQRDEDEEPLQMLSRIDLTCEQ